jgi:hypothetical protein
MNVSEVLSASFVSIHGSRDLVSGECRESILHGRIKTVDEKTEGQLRVIRTVIAVMQAAGISAWLFGAGDRRPDGSFSQPLGRFSDWLFPPGSFGDEPGMLDSTPVLAMSASGMLAMKEQFPHLRHGRPWRQKDIADIEILRGLAASATYR